MGHPLVEAFCRQGGTLQPEFYRRCQRVFREEVQPMLDERDRLLEENARLKDEIATLRAQLDKTARRAAAKEPVSA
jgi:regulator of replication initiation timing